MRTAVLLALVAALAVTVAVSGEEAEKPVRAMTRSELMKELEQSRSALHQHKADLKKANHKVAQLREELDAITDEDEYEGNRKANERKSKANDKKSLTPSPTRMSTK